MGSDDIFHQRGEALENQFFAKVDRELIEKLRLQEAASALQALLGNVSPDLAKSLLELGLTSTTFAAIKLVPLVSVAWGDGSIDDSEKEVVLKAAQSQGIASDSPAGKLLASWLTQAPPAQLLVDWCEYVKALLQKLSDSEAKTFKESIVAGIHAVANASGGVLGWAAVSQGESKVMHKIEAALGKS